MISILMEDYMRVSNLLLNLFLKFLIFLEFFISTCLNYFSLNSLVISEDIYKNIYMYFILTCHLLKTHFFLNLPGANSSI